MAAIRAFSRSVFRRERALRVLRRRFISLLINDLPAFVLAERRQPVAPCLECLGRLACPVRHLADDFEWLPTGSS